HTRSTRDWSSDVCSSDLYWSLGGGWERKMAWLGVVPLAAALNVAYMSAIPAFFLIEADTAAERNPWTEHCFVRGAELRPIRTPRSEERRVGKGRARGWAR